MANKSLKNILLAGTAAALLSTPSLAQTYVDITSDIGTFQPVTLGDDVSLDPCGSRITTTSNSNLASLCDITSGTSNVSLYYLISKDSVTHSLSFGTLFDGIQSTIDSSIVNPSGGTTNVGSASAAAILSSPAAVSTGAGTLFSTAGTYVVSLIATIKSGSSGNTGVFNVGNNAYRGGGDSGLLLSNTGLDVNGSTVGNFDGITIGSLAVISGSNPADGNTARNVSISQTTLVVNPVASVPEPSSMAMLLGGLLFGWRTHRRKKLA